MDSDSNDLVRNGGIIELKNVALLKSIMGNFKSIIGSSLLTYIESFSLHMLSILSYVSTIKLYILLYREIFEMYSFIADIILPFSQIFLQP